MGSRRAVSLDQLAALNDEMAALVRAGVPLEVGLPATGRELPRRLRRIADDLSQRMQTGASLEQVLASDQNLPPVWRSVVLAGLRSGQLAAALEGLSATARRIAERRRIVGLALIYPLIVVLLAYVMFLFLVMYSREGFAAVVDLTGSVDPFLASLVWLREEAAWVLLALPAVAVLGLVAGWWRLGRAPEVVAERRRRRLLPWPSLRQSLRDGRLATFAEILSLLVRQQVPLHEALVLSAEASGDRGLSQAAREVAWRLQAGQSVAGGEAIPPPLPRLLGWLLSTGASADELSNALAQTAQSYRQRAARAAAWNALYLPVLLTVFVGGTATLLLALAVIAPVWRLLHTLSYG